MTLQELLDHVLTSGGLTPKSLAPMRSAVKQYASALGGDLADLQPESYHLAPDRVKQLIEAQADEHVAAKTIANRWQFILRLLSIGVQRGWLTPSPTDLTYSWTSRRRLLPYGHFPSRKDSVVNRTRYRLHPLPPALTQDLEAYLGWCSKPFTPGRRPPPRSIRKRAITTQNARDAIASLAGFAVRHLGIAPDDLTLSTICTAELCEQFAGWWINERQGKVTRGLIGYLIQVQTIAKYWLDAPQQAEAIHRLVNAELPHPEGVFIKETVWLSLAQLAIVAESTYPLNERRLKESRHTRAMARYLANPTHYKPAHATGQRMAHQAEVSLLLYLLIEYPWRQRQWRDMLVDKHLRTQPDGSYLLHFSGKDLKVERRSDGHENELNGIISGQLAHRMHEWLTLWRPLLIQRSDERHVFVGFKGQPIDAWSFGYWIKSATYRFAGVRVHPHLIRDIWASEYLDATGDVAGAAKRLGNTPQTIFRHYGHILEKRAQQRTTSWLHDHLASPQPHRNGSHDTAPPPPSWRAVVSQPPERPVDEPQRPLL